MCYIDRMEIKTPFGAALRHCRKKRGLSQGVVARALKTSQATITKLETGKMYGSAKLREAVADFFGMTYTDFLEYGKEKLNAGNIIPYDNILSQFDDKGLARALIESLADMEKNMPEQYKGVVALVLGQKMAAIEPQKKRS